MRKHLNDYLFSPLAWLLTIILIVLLVVVVLLLTPVGVKVIASTADSALKELSIKGVSGTLLSGLHIDEIIWDDGDSIALKNVDLKVQYFNADRGRLVAEKVVAERLTINIATASTGGDITSLPNFGLPLNMNAHLIQLDSLRITKNVPDDPEARTLLFQVRNIQLKKVTISDGLLRFRRLQGSPIIIDHPLKINVTEGRLNMNQPHDIKTSGNISYKHPDLGDVDGEIELDGTLTDYRFEGAVNHQQKTLGKQSIKILGQGNYKRIHLEKVALESAHGKITAKGRLLWDPEITWAFIVEANELSTKKFLAEWPATVNTEFRYAGSYIDSRLENKINILSLDGTLREYDLKLQGRVTEREGVIITDDLSLEVGENKFKVTGRANEPFNLKWEVDAKDISQVLPENLKDLNITGSLIGNGVLKGNINKPELKLDLIAENLAYKEFKQGKEALVLTGEVALKNKKDLFVKTLSVKSGLNSAHVSGQASEPFNLKWDIDAQSLKQLSPQLAGQIKGDGVLKGEIKKPEVKLNITARNLAFKGFKQGKEAIVLKGEVALDEKENIQLKDLSLKSGVNTLQVSGQASEPFHLKLNVDAKKLSQISPQLNGQINGNGLLKGSLEKPEAEIKLKLSNLVFNEVKQGKEPLFVEGKLDLDRSRGDNKDVITLKDLIARSGSNSIHVSGQASEPLNLQIKIDAQQLSQVSPDLAGRIQGGAQVLGAYASPVIKADLRASQLRYQQTRIAQTELLVKGEVQLVDGVPMIKELISQVGKNKVQISGRASSPYDLTWNVDSKNLSQLMPDLSGSIVAQGRLQGTIEQPIINAMLDAKKLRYKEFELGSANVKAQTTNGNYQIKGKLSDLKSVDQKIKSAKVELNGRVENHTIIVSLDHKEAKVNMKASGGWVNQKWKGLVQRLSLADTQAGDWKLQSPTSLSLSKSSFSSSKFCFSNKKTQACSSGTSWSEVAGLQTKGTLQKTPLSLLKPFLPEGMELNGTVNGSYDIKQNNGKPTGNIKIKLPNSTFTIKDEDGEEQTFGYQEAELSATINNRTIKAKARMNIVNRGKFLADATIKLSPENGRHTIKGSVQFDVPNINWAQNFIPHSRGLRGAFNSKLTFSGLLNKPKIVGKASLKNGYLRLPEAGTELTSINLNMVADNPGQAVVNGKMLMGKGALNVTGKLDIRDLINWKANIKISGNNIRFMNTNEIRALMSPDLTIDLSPKFVDIKGKVIIPQADINLKEIPETSIDESGDVYVVGEKKKGQQVSAIRVRPNVLIRLGDKVKLKAFGLRAKLSGDVNVTHNRRDIIANGSLRVTDGKYQAYGQNLEINNGRLIFNGSPKLIGMDIRATRKVDDTIVGVHLGGTLLSPKSKIFSDPTLPESEALSFLITGHSLSTASGKESALLMSAVRGLGVTGNDSLIHNIGSSLGLDDVNIVTDADIKKSKLQLGKRLGSRLYVRYLIGLFDQAQKITVEYKINKMLSLEAETSVDNYGLDFIYEIDRD